MGTFKNLLVAALAEEGYEIKVANGAKLSWSCTLVPKRVLQITRHQLLIYAECRLTGAIFRVGFKQQFIEDAMQFINHYAPLPV